MYLKASEKHELIAEVSDAGLILFEYYLSRYSYPEQGFTDKGAAKALGWSERKVQRTRLHLTKMGWFHQATGKYGDGASIYTTYLGKKEVLKRLPDHPIIGEAYARADGEDWTKEFMSEKVH